MKIERNKVAGIILILGGIFILYLGYLESIDASYYGIPYRYIEEIINHVATETSEGVLSSIILILFQIYTKFWLLTIGGGLCSIVGGLMIIYNRVDRGKEIAHFSELGLASLIYALIFQYFEVEYETILNAVPGLGPVDLEIITPEYFLAWIVYIAFYVATWMAKEPVETITKIETVPKPSLPQERTCIECGAVIKAEAEYCPKCGAKQ